jgi:hypothetical protein
MGREEYEGLHQNAGPDEGGKLSNVSNWFGICI